MPGFNAVLDIAKELVPSNFEHALIAALVSRGAPDLDSTRVLLSAIDLVDRIGPFPGRAVLRTE